MEKNIPPTQNKKLMQQVSDAIKTKHYSSRTGETYDY